MSPAQCYSLCSRGSTYNWNYVYPSGNCVQQRLSTNLPLLYQCYHLFKETLRRKLLSHFSGGVRLFRNCQTKGNNILNSHNRENLKSIRKRVKSPSSSGWSFASKKTDKIECTPSDLAIYLCVSMVITGTAFAKCALLSALVAPIISL
jgi:hypothetical protein